VADEYLHPELVLQGADLLRDPRLGGMQRLGGLRDVQAAARNLGKATELLKFHYAFIT
jgi:hypothetical protein